MTEILHCHFCGGVIPKGARVKYLPPRASAQLAIPHDGLCDCKPPVVYQDPPVMEHEDDAGPGP